MEKTMNELNENFWNEFDFSDGELLYAETQLSESMLCVNYLYSGNKESYLSLYIGNGYGDDRSCFHIEIIWDNNFQKPVACYYCKTAESLKELVYIALKQIYKELAEHRLSYYGALWETVIIRSDE